jgi:hypothetical protein
MGHSEKKYSLWLLAGPTMGYSKENWPATMFFSPPRSVRVTLQTKTISSPGKSAMQVQKGGIDCDCGKQYETKNGQLELSPPGRWGCEPQSKSTEHQLGTLSQKQQLFQPI